MIVDNATFIEITQCLERASEGMREGSGHLARVIPEENIEGLIPALDSFICVNEHFCELQRLLKAIHEANKAEKPSSTQ